MLRPNKKYTATEAKVLDTALILHMEHGGGNNSTFTTRVITSSGSDTYSTIAAAMSSLKGPKHGGANIKVMEMMEDIRLHVPDCSDKEALADYLAKIINRDAFDRKGLVWHRSRRLFPVRPQRADFQGYVESSPPRRGGKGLWGLSCKDHPGTPSTGRTQQRHGHAELALSGSRSSPPRAWTT